MRPTLGVVIPLFNGRRWIEQTLSAVAAQDARPDEVIVVDDGSTDGSEVLARRFEGVRVVPSLRKTRARHTGLLEASADLIAFLDQDDLWHPAHLALLRDVLERRPSAPAASSDWRVFFDGEPPALTATPLRVKEEDPWAAWPLRCPFPTPSSVLFRREDLLAAGGWALDAAPDWEAYLRITGPGTIPRLRARTCGYRQHAGARSTALRRDGFRYLEIHRRGADASLRARLRRGVDDRTRAWLSRRRRVLDHLADLIHGLRSGERTRAGEAARGLERDLAGERRPYVAACFQLLAYLFCPGDDADAFVAMRDDLLRELAGVWPPDAPRTRRILDAHRMRLQFRWRRLLRAALRGRVAEARRQWAARRDAAH